MSLIGELKRRNVFRVAVVYCVVSWVILQFADVFGGLLELPAWTGKLIVLLLAVGLPVALMVSWVYEITPEGLVRTSAVDPARSIAPHTGRRLDRMIMAGLALAIVVLLLDRYIDRDRSETTTATQPTEPTATAAAAPRSIGVLPFVNMSNDPANEYFSDGMSEEILNTLAGVDGLRVAARTSSFQFRGQTLDVREIGKRLGVGAVLEGSVRRQGDAVRITAQLVDVENGYHLWSKTFDRTLENVFAVQTEIATQIASALQIESNDSTSAGPAPGLRQLPTENAVAYELFLQGRHLWRQRNAPALKEAIQLLTQAVDLDPQFAEAHAALASTYFVMQNYASVDVTDVHGRAREAAERAQALDDSLAEPVAVLAMIRLAAREWGAAERGLRRAIELDTDQATPHHWLALEYQTTGHIRKFATEAQRAYALDPTNAGIVSLVGVSQQLAGDMPAAIRSYELAASMGGVFAAVTRLPDAYYEAGQPDQALAARRRGYATIGRDAGLAELIHAAVLDPARREQARVAILTAPRESYSANHRISDLMRIGEYEVAVNEALTAQDALPIDLLYAAWYASYRAFRETAAFHGFVRETGLLEYWRESGWPDLCRPAGEDFVCD